MNLERISRWSGLIAMAAGAFWVAYELAQIVGMISPLLDPKLDLFAHSLVALAAVGLYARMAEQAGLLGLIAFVGYMGMALVNTAMKVIYSIVVPVLASQYPEAGTAVGSTPAWSAFTAIWLWLTVLAPIGFGGAMIVSRVYPRWAAALIVIGPVVGMTVGPLITGALGMSGNLGALISAAGWTWLGYAAWSGQGESFTAEQPRPALAQG